MQQLTYYFKRVTWLQVKTVLMSWDYYCPKEIRAFKSVFYRLKNMHPIPDTKYINVFKDDCWAYYSETRYEEDFMELGRPCANYLGMVVLKEKRKQITDEEVVASCLWTMSDIGHSERRMNEILGI